MKDSTKIKIFLVDDDDMFIKALKNQLKDKRAEIKTFNSGQDCLECIQDYPQIIVLDYALNDSLNGVQVLNKIKQNSPETKVIMLSGSTRSRVKTDTLKYGAYDYIEKSKEGMLHIKKEVKMLYDEIEEDKDIEKEKRELWWINGGIIMLIVLMYLINHLKK
jgi:DNA-binding NtrC family response regulator